MNAPIRLTPEPDEQDGAHTVETLLAVIDAIAAIEDPRARHDELIAWARSDLWHSGGMFLEGKAGAMHREAAAALKGEYETATPAKRWYDAGTETGRASIRRLLGQEGDDGFYATAPFRTMQDDGETLIGAAVGCQPLLDARAFGAWLHIDIADVILWNPRTNKARLAGDHHSAPALITPWVPFDRLVVYADPLAFFRAWAAERAETIKRHRTWATSIHEARDGGLPGALAIGRLDRMPWLSIHAPTLLSGPGVSKRDLSAAVLSAAHLPSVAEA